MPQWEQVIDGARRSPNNVRWSEFVSAIERVGFECRIPRKDSHWMVIYTADGWRLSVPVHNNHAKGVYVRKILNKFDESRGE